ncbi:hypothetical protein HMPREF1326_03317 [Akkermansia sp. KLE1605]|nr:hypothetical protein HMPREF1326_03317 [Akkermansia sp. KLE1605]
MNISRPGFCGTRSSFMIREAGKSFWSAGFFSCLGGTNDI